MTADKLFGAAAGYLMLGVMWAYFYVLIAYFYPDSFSIGGQPGPIAYHEALYFSITVLTSTGFGDIVPLSRQARGVCMVEQIAGALFLAILIARPGGRLPAASSALGANSDASDEALLRQELRKHLEPYLRIVDLEHALLDRQRQRQELREAVADPGRVVVVGIGGEVLRADARGDELEQLRQRQLRLRRARLAARRRSPVTSPTTSPYGSTACCSTWKRVPPTVATCRMPSCGMSQFADARERADRRDLGRRAAGPSRPRRPA